MRVKTYIVVVAICFAAAVTYFANGHTTIWQNQKNVDLDWLKRVAIEIKSKGQISGDSPLLVGVESICLASEARLIAKGTKNCPQAGNFIAFIRNETCAWLPEAELPGRVLSGSIDTECQPVTNKLRLLKILRNGQSFFVFSEIH